MIQLLRVTALGLYGTLGSRRSELRAPAALEEHLDRCLRRWLERFLAENFDEKLEPAIVRGIRAWAHRQASAPEASGAASAMLWSLNSTGELWTSENVEGILSVALKRYVRRCVRDVQKELDRNDRLELYERSRYIREGLA